MLIRRSPRSLKGVRPLFDAGGILQAGPQARERTAVARTIPIAARRAPAPTVPSG